MLRRIPMASRALPAYRALIAGLVFFELTHFIGLFTMGSCLLPGLYPAWPTAERIAYVSAHVLRWRLGWLPWQLSAASDVWVTLALIAWTRALGARHAQRWAMWSAAFVLLASVPEQYAEARLVTDFVRVSVESDWHARLGSYMGLIGTWASAGYTLMTACWLQALRCVPRIAASKHAHQALQRVTLLAFGAASCLNMLTWNGTNGAENLRAFQIAAALAGLAFCGLLWLGAVVALQVQDRQRPQANPVT
jgi:hypothetical protein